MKATMIKFFQNKYGITTIVFLFIICLTDRYSVLSGLRMNRKIEKLEKVSNDYQEQIVDLKEKIELVKSDKIRVAREKYFYKEANELLILVDDKNQD